MKTLLLLLTLSTVTNIFSQQTQPPRKIITVPVTYPLIQSTTKKLNSTFRNEIGGASRSYIEITMPPLVIEWSYSFTTRPVVSNPQTLQLAEQITRLLSPFVPGGPIFRGLTEMAIKSISVPQGSIPVNIYVLDAANINLFLNRQPFNYLAGTSATNATHATVSIKNLKWGTYYIAIDNYSWTKAVLVDIEAVAVVLERRRAQSN